jgi:hypothetical protein
MKKKLRGLGHREIQLDFNLYRVPVSIRDLSNVELCLCMAMPAVQKRGSIR